MNYVLIIGSVVILLGAASMLPAIGTLKRFDPISKYDDNHPEERKRKYTDLQYEAHTARTRGKAISAVSTMIALVTGAAGVNGDTGLWLLALLVPAFLIIVWWLGWRITYRSCLRSLASSW